MDAAIRERRRADLPRCVALLAQSHTLHRYPVHWPADPSGWLSPAGMAHAWVATATSEVVGHVCVVRHRDPGDGLRLERLFVSQQAQGHGRALVDAATTWATEHRHRLTLDVLENCTDAIRLYRALGWRLLEEIPIDWAGDVARTVLRFEAP